MRAKIAKLQYQILMRFISFVRELNYRMSWFEVSLRERALRVREKSERLESRRDIKFFQESTNQ